MENTVCSAYSGLVPMSPKTMPSAASTTPPAHEWALGCSGAVSAPSDATSSDAGWALGAGGAVPRAGWPASTLGPAADADPPLRAGPGIGSLVTRHPQAQVRAPRSVHPTSASPQQEGAFGQWKRSSG